MTEKDNEKTKAIRSFLESYGTNKKLLSMLEYEEDFFKDEASPDPFTMPEADTVLIRARMLEVRRYISNIEDGNCKLLLFYHYIRGFPVEKCAELMNIGRTTAFRIKKKALLLGVKEERQGELLKKSPPDPLQKPL